MRLSKFNIILDKTDGTYIYNTLTSSVLKLTDEYKQNFSEFYNSQNSDVLFKDLTDNLRLGKMIVNDDLDEISYIKNIHYMHKYSNAASSYTIAPTLECNFRCPYCYEKGKNYTTMDEGTIDNLTKMIEENSNISKYLSICWYGGEPLLAFDIIEKLSLVAIDKFNNYFEASMVTNGYLLSKDIVEKLEKLHIKTIQITIDGPPEIHNKRRRLPNGGDTFFKILENIQNAIKINNKLNISIRINVDKNNINESYEILEYFEKYNLKDKVAFYTAPVDNINNTYTNSSCFTNKEYAKEQISFLRYALDKGFICINLPLANPSICGAVSSNNFVIGPKGELYKCWDDIGYESEELGNIGDNGYELLENNNYRKWINYSPFDSECEECIFLPSCMGGCPNKRVKEQSKGCITIKENYTDMINLLIQQKELLTHY